jgi:hypothetical protein
MRSDTLARIVGYLGQHPEVATVNGLISLEHPNPDFFSQYKNLYMHFIFRRLPEEITFLHGSLYAVRRECAVVCAQPTITDDTARGQQLFEQKKKIVVLKDLEVVHLKKYSWWGFVRNDFIIPYSWAYVFLRHRGWKQLGKKGTGFAHASRGQLLSVILAPTIALLAVLSPVTRISLVVPAALGVFWFLLNWRFLFFLTQARGFWFGLRSVAVTFMDGIIMAVGIGCGLLRWAPVVIQDRLRPAMKTSPHPPSL